MQSLWQDLRYAFRLLWKSPGVTLGAVVALALGIGANSAIFSLINAVVLRPLPYKEPDRLVLAAYAGAEAAPANYLDWKNQTQSFESIAAVNFWNANLGGVNEPERLQGFQITSELFPLLGIQPTQGRNFVAADEQPGSDNVIILSNGLWQRRFNSDPGIVGKTVVLNSRSYEVVGIMPPNFVFYRPADVWAPLAFTPEDARKRAPGSLIVAARLKPGVTLQRAQGEMTALARRLEQQYPELGGSQPVTLVSLHNYLIGPARPALLILLGAVIFVLLIGCANVANLLLARAVARQKEIAIRAAMGAKRARIIRQLLTESVLLSVLGGLLGLLLALWGTKLLVVSMPQSSVSTLLGMSKIGIDWRVLGFTLIISLITGLAFGLAPALQVSKVDLNETLKEGGRGTAGNLRGRRLRGLLVITEVGLSLVLLIGAGLMLKSFTRLLSVNPGFDPNNVVAMDMALPQTKYANDQQVNAFYQKTLEHVRGVPGVQFVGVTSNLPLGGSNKVRGFEIEGQTAVPGRAAPAANYRVTDGDYFRVLNIPLLKGRYFNEQDTEGRPGVALINETMAKRYLPNEDPMGKRIRRLGPPGSPPLPWREIVGVVKDIRTSSLAVTPRPEMYVPYSQEATPELTLVVRGNTDPLRLVPAVRSEILSLDRELPVYNVMTMNEVITNSVFLTRFSMYLLALFGVVALVMAAVGIYSVMSYSVTQRQHEIGIRMALGAVPRDVVKLIVRQGLSLALVGVAAGLVAAFVVMRLLSSLLYGVSSTDLLTFGATALVLVAVGFVASYFPARRATKVDPMIALRYE